MDQFQFVCARVRSMGVHGMDVFTHTGILSSSLDLLPTTPCFSSHVQSDVFGFRMENLSKEGGAMERTSLYSRQLNSSF
jgi:hypothetical protein